MQRRYFLKSAAAVGAAAVLPVREPGASAAQAQSNTPPKEPYLLGPDSKKQPGVPVGHEFSFTLEDSKFFPGTRRAIDVYIPAQYTGENPACVWVSFDGLFSTVPAVFDNLIHRGDIPVMIAVGVHPGITPSAAGEQNPRFDRSYEVDSLTDLLARFVVEQVLPAVEKQRTPTGLPIRLSKSPNDRGITGASSGGIAAFTAAWQRPDDFRRVYTMIGTYVGMRGGDGYPVLVRKTEPKPLRLFLQDGEKDGWPGGLELGDWWTSNLAMERALSFAGYAVNHAWGVEGHDVHQGEAILPNVMRWLWKDWPAPVREGETENFAIRAIAKPGEGWIRISDLKGSGAASSLASDPRGRIFIQIGEDGVVYKLSATGRLEEFAHANPGSGAIAFGPDHRLYVVDPAGERIVAIEPHGNRVVIAKGIKVCGLTVTHNGNLYATEAGPCANDSFRTGRIWLVRPDGSKSIVAEGLNGPSGIAITPDGFWLCATQRQEHRGFSYQLQPDGGLRYGEPLIWFHVPETASDSGAAQLCIDRQGWGYAATRMGVQVFDRNGRVTAIFPIREEQLTGLCFGGEDFQTLYAATREGLYRRRVQTVGMPPWEKPTVLPPWSAA